MMPAIAAEVNHRLDRGHAFDDRAIIARGAIGGGALRSGRVAYSHGAL